MTTGQTRRRDWDDVDGIKATLLSRRTITTTGCWEWTGGARRYPKIRIGGDQIGVHHASLWVWKGVRIEDPHRFVGMHSCDNPCCFNPEHLLVGTYQENTRDAIAKRRRAPKNATSTCYRGHEYDEANTYWHRGHRYCRACHTNNRRCRAERQTQ